MAAADGGFHLEGESASPEQTALRKIEGTRGKRQFRLDPFFDEQRAQSRVKTDIVVKYLEAWAKIMVDRPPHFRAAYIDLFAGAGRYADDEPSTPVRVLEMMIANPKLAAKLVAFLNEMRAGTYARLQTNVSAIPGIAGLTNAPGLSNFEVNDDVAKRFAELRLIPTLLFADPYGYKGLTLDLIYSILKNPGSECIFFFNYNRIYMGLNNNTISRHINAIFGTERADALRASVNASPRPDAVAREALVLKALRDALSKIDGTYSLAFRFRRSLNKTSHYLIFVSKHNLGHKIMKEVMAKMSSSHPQGVASFDFVVPDPRRGLTLELATPLDDLKNDLLLLYTGKRIAVDALYREHNPTTPFTMTNYKEALKQLLAEGRIRCSRPSGSPIKANTMPDDVVVEFP